jgi:hypothetical protein
MNQAMVHLVRDLTAPLVTWYVLARDMVVYG